MFIFQLKSILMLLFIDFLLQESTWRLPNQLTYF